MELQPCPECGNTYLAVRADLYKDCREFVYCDVCGCLTDRRVWNKVSRSPVVGAVGGEPRTAEQTLTAQGVFKGADGLRRLAECQDFWDRQPYGTRLYFEDAGDGYLHRDVLRAAVKALASPTAAGPMTEEQNAAMLWIGETRDQLRKMADEANKVLTTALFPHGIGVSPTGSPEGEVSNG